MSSSSDKNSSKAFYSSLVSQRIITIQQLKECARIQKELASLGLEKRSLLSLLLEKKYIQQQQILPEWQIYLKEKSKSSSLFPVVATLPEIQGYTLRKRIGQGAMGTVYLARQNSMKRDVAIKVLSKELAQNPDFIQRFHREARASAKLHHPNIINGIDFGEFCGIHYFVMEYIQGKTLHQLLEQGPLSETKALEILKEVVIALEVAYQAQLIHRDIKPDNIMISEETGEVKLLDFGLVKQKGSNQATQIEATLGTPNYVSPEQARGEEVDCRADIYSLGATLFHLVTGKPPFSGENPLIVLSKHLFQPLPDPKELNPEISAHCANLIFKMMEKEKEKRFQNPTELLSSLQNILPKKRFFSPQELPNTPPPAPNSFPPKPPTLVLKRKSYPPLAAIPLNVSEKKSKLFLKPQSF
jgi:serine/threonine protein kinase